MKFAPSVVNLSSAAFSSSELQLLQYGKKFCLPPVDQKSKLKTIVVSDLANGIRGDRRLNTDRVRNLINDMISQLYTPLTPELRTYFGLKRRLNQEDLVLVKADRGETLVIMQRTQYDMEVLQFLESAGANHINSPSTSYNKEVRDTINKSKYILPEKFSFLRQMSPSLPKIYGQVKIKKNCLSGLWSPFSLTRASNWRNNSLNASVMSADLILHTL